MIFNVKSAKLNVAVFIALIYSVSSYPHPSDINAEDIQLTKQKKQDNKKIAERKHVDKEKLVGDNQQKKGALTEKVNVFVRNDKKHLKLPSQNEKLYLRHETGQRNSNYQQNKGAITGNIELNDENIEGHIELPSDTDNLQQQYPKNKLNYNNQQNKKVITGSIKLNDDNIEGHIELPSDTDNLQQRYPKNKLNYNNQQNKKVITGSIKLNDDNMEGHIELPSDTDNLQQQYPKNTLNYNKQQNKKVITGSIKLNDENIEGYIELPSDTDNLQQQYPKNKFNNNNQQNEDLITGNIEINDENIEGYIDLPSDPNKEKYTDKLKQNDGDVIAGSINITDENIEGHIDLPSDPDKEKYTGDLKQNDGDAVAGSLNINDENIEGHIDLPTDPDKEKYTDDLKQNDGDAIAGSININDENIEGHIDLPSDPDKEKYTDNPKQNDGDIVAGSININDENIEGHIELPSDDGIQQNVPDSKNMQSDDKKQPQSKIKSDKNCWMNLKAKHHLDALDKIDATYAQARQNYQAQVGKEFDKRMLEVMLQSQGAAPRAIHQAQGDPRQIPAGINLGGACMMRMPGSILFFHRTKLRNSTRFSVNYLQTDLMKMTLTARLALNDLHLIGAYERATSGRNPGILYYMPNYGEVEILLRRVFYKMEGRLRMLNNRLIVELVNSDLMTNDILMAYVNSSTSTKLESRNIEDFLERLKADLDLWLKDYFNDYLMYFGIVGGSNSEILTYEKKKTVKVNEYAEDAIIGIKKRLRSLGASSVKLPNFQIFSFLNININLMNGELRGLDSIYRRSVATTTTKENKIRLLDVIVGFSNLKVEYKYEAQIASGKPPLVGKLILTADELTAHMQLRQLARPETVDLNFDSIMQAKPNSLTVEGPASRMIANFRQTLEHPIIAIMANTMKHNINMLKTLPRCVPYLYGTGRHILAGEVGNKTYVANENQEDYIQPADNADKYTYDVPHNDSDNENHPNNSIEENAPENLGDQISDLSSGEGNGNNEDWSDYILSKNDSVEVVVPVDSTPNKLKLDRNENFVLIP